MTNQQHKDPLHGVTLETILRRLVERYGWAEMGRRVPIQCFRNNPSVKSSLQFLRRTPWARKQVEELYLRSLPFPEADG
jgi:uncharacterized protein (DUF2132 family)